MGAYSRVPITWRGMRAVRAIGCLRYSHTGHIADVVKRPVVLGNGEGVPPGRGGMQKVRSPCGSADLRGTPVVRNSLSGGRPSPGAWRRRAR